MGRLVERVGRETIDRMPPLQRWINRHPYVSISTYMILSILAVLVNVI